MLLEKVDVLKAQGDLIMCTSAVLEVPSVIRLRYYVKRPWTDIPLTRQNIHLRDNHKCQYCGSSEHLTIDHVKPRKRGGEFSWENVVTACFRCNNKKGDKPLEESGLVLRTKPRKPSRTVLYRYASKEADVWADFLAHAN
jgi:5-methylcytosine-specific restriction endonuclease McrA